MKDLGYGQEYQYAHDAPGNFVNQEYMPDAISGNNYFHPGSSQKEQEVYNNLVTKFKQKYK
jgi:putative ATPase